MKRVLIFIATSLLGFNFINAQTIDSMRVLPSSPNSTDTVRLICYTTFLYSPCILDSAQINVSGFQINICGYYRTGIGSTICHRKDTILIGSFVAGSYQLIYCGRRDTSMLFDIDTLNFSISLTNILETSITENHFVLFPNPFNDFTHFKTDIPNLPDVEFVIFDVIGNEIRRNNIRNQDNIIFKNDLAKGVYSYKVLCHNTCLYIGKFVIL